MSRKSSYVTKMEKYLQTKDIHPATLNTECQCEPTFTINGNIHFTVPVCQYADSNKIAQGIMALEIWDDLMIQKTKCRNFEHIANKEFECFELKCTNSTNKEEKDFLEQQTKFMEVDQKTCRLDRIKQENLKYGTPTKTKVINNHIDFNKARPCPCTVGEMTVFAPD
jgi:hypothetical protein